MLSNRQTTKLKIPAGLHAISLPVQTKKSTGTAPMDKRSKLFKKTFYDFLKFRAISKASFGLNK